MEWDGEGDHQPCDSPSIRALLDGSSRLLGSAELQPQQLPQQPMAPSPLQGLALEQHTLAGLLAWWALEAARPPAAPAAGPSLAHLPPPLVPPLPWGAPASPLLHGAQGEGQRRDGATPGSCLPAAVSATASSSQQGSTSVSTRGAVAVSGPSGATSREDGSGTPHPCLSARRQVSGQPAAAARGQRRPGRGRKPRSEEAQEEAKQHTREVQKQYLARKKIAMQEMEASLTSISAEVEREREQLKCAHLKGAAYKSMLDYRGEMQGLMQAAGELDPLSGISIPGPVLDMMRRERLTGPVLESILTYAPTGYTDNQDEAGRVRSAPPFEVVARDFADIAAGMRQLLEETRVCRASQPAALAPIALPAAARESRAGELSPSSSGEGSSGGGTPTPIPAMPASASMLHPQVGPPSAQQLEDKAAQGGAAPLLARAGSQAAAPDGAEAGSSGAPPRLAPSFVGLSSRTKDVLQKGEMEVRDGEDLYRFSGTQLQCMGVLLRRMALLSWQQAVLFPLNANKMVSLRLDTCELGQDGDNMPRFRQLVRQLRLSPEQLKKIAERHQIFMAAVRPALANQRAALERLREMNAQGLSSSPQAHTVVSECNAALVLSVGSLNAAIGSMAHGLFNIMEFPLQKAKLVVLSWPHYPQLHAIGTAVALELGLDMELYESFSAELYGGARVGGGGAVARGSEWPEGGVWRGL